MVLPSHFSSNNKVESQSALNLSGANTSAFLSLQVQLMLVQDFDAQMQDVGKKMKFINDIKKQYRQNITQVQEYLGYRKDKNGDDPIIKLTPTEAIELMNSLKSYEYDLSSLESGVQTVFHEIQDSGKGHDLDKIPEGATLENRDADNFFIEIENGQVSVDEYIQFFEYVAEKGQTAEALQFAQKAGLDKVERLFYVGKQAFESGDPVIAFFVEPLEKQIEIFNSKMADLEASSEKLSLDFESLSAKRKAALDVVGQMVQKMDELRAKFTTQF